MSDEKDTPSGRFGTVSQLPLTPEQRTAAALKRRAAKNDAETKARAAQFADDIEAIEAIENRDDVELHYSEQVKQFVPGLPVIVGARAPDKTEYKRLLSKMNRQGATGDAKVAALVELAAVCWTYPEDPKVREAMVEANPGLLASLGNFVNSLAEVGIREEGKG